MGREHTILVVDDNPEVLETMRIALEGQGYTTVVAADGNQALAEAERFAPDLIILDLMLPRQSGFQVIERLRRGWPRIVMTTGSAEPEHEAHARRLGVSAFLKKPFDVDELLRMVQDLLDP